MIPETFTADYVGQPGERTFYLQATTTSGTRSYLVEKQQVLVLAERLKEMLLAIDSEDTVVSAQPARDPSMRLVAPVEPEWRVGTMGIAYEEETDRIVLACEPIEESTDPDSEDEALEQVLADVLGANPDGVRFFLRRDQVRSFVLHSTAVVAEGRPTCQLCGLPMDPDGHFCPATNGHKTEA